MKHMQLYNKSSMLCLSFFSEFVSGATGSWVGTHGGFMLWQWTHEVCPCTKVLPLESKLESGHLAVMIRWAVIAGNLLWGFLRRRPIPGGASWVTLRFGEEAFRYMGPWPSMVFCESQKRRNLQHRSRMNFCFSISIRRPLRCCFYAKQSRINCKKHTLDNLGRWMSWFPSRKLWCPQGWDPPRVG